MPTPELDYENRPVPADEGPGAVIKVWEVTPHLDRHYDCLIVRGWQEMLDQVRNVAEHRLENPDDELPDVTIRVRLREMTRAEYDELYGD